MLRGIRKASENWLGRIVMAAVMFLLAGVFGLWGINDIFTGFGRSTLAKIGNTEIGDRPSSSRPTAIASIRSATTSASRCRRKKRRRSGSTGKFSVK